MWRFLKKLEIVLPYNPAIPVLGIHTEETRTERDTRTSVFITALCTIARTWKQPRCPSADEWIRKLWYIYTMDYYSATKKKKRENPFKSVLMTWVKLEPIMQSEERKKSINTVYSCIYMEFRKIVTTTLYARQQKRHRCKEQTLGLCGRRQGWDDLREQH